MALEHRQQKTHRYARGVTIMGLLLRIETHAAAIGLPGSAIEYCGPVTITVGSDPEQPIAARLTGPASAAEVRAARERMRVLGVPERFEWIDELVPGQEAAFTEEDLVVRRHPLLVLRSLVRPATRPGITIERVGADSPDDLASTAAAVGAIAFANAAEGARLPDTTEVELATALLSRSSELARTRASLADNRSTLWLARLEGLPAATAWCVRHDGIVEIVGVGTVAAYRGRGLASAVTWHAADAALADGAEVVFLTAEDAKSAKLYARLGFETIATVCIAESPV
jgi:ribosomal protein S18 acetylase RimI-like enzyme